MPLALTARYVFPVSRPPIENGVVVVDGREIVSVGGEIPANARRINLNDLAPSGPGGAAILPGLVNAHTHLEFSNLPSPLGSPGMGFADWIAEVIRRRRAEAALPDAALRRRRAIDQGLAEIRAAGATSLGEIAAFAPGLRDYESAAGQLLVFREFLGLSEAQVAEAAHDVSNFLSAWACARPLVGWQAGLSPHAPYSTHCKIVELLCKQAGDSIPVAMHVAESREELELLQSRSGPLRRLLDELGVWNAEAIPRGTRALDYLRQLAAAQRSLVIHGNYLADDEIGFLAQRADRMSLVYCPRTHAYFHNEPYPLAKMLAAGVNVALGTDSRASNPDLSLLEEMQHVARRHPQIPPHKVLQLGTINGAKALGLHEKAGSLEPGKRADLAAVALPATGATEPHELLLESDLPAVATFVGGRRT